MNAFTKTWDNLSVVKTSESFDVMHQGKLHRSFAQERHFRTWLCELNLTVGELRKKDEQVPIAGKYATAIHTDVEEFNKTDVFFVTKSPNYGEYTLALISDKDGLRTLNMMAPTTFGRIIFNKRRSKEFVG